MTSCWRCMRQGAGGVDRREQSRRLVMNAPTAVVVGVSAERGLGAALCRRFAAEGYHVLIAGRTPEKIEQVARTIREARGSAEAVVADTTREADIVRVFDRTM